MALTVSGTSAITKPVNTIFEQTLLRNAKARCPYFIGSTPGEIMRGNGSNVLTMRRMANLSDATTALSEVSTASYMQGHTPASLSVTPITATLAKYGNFVILNEEVEAFVYNAHMDKIMEVIGINAGSTLNVLHRNTLEDNGTMVYAAAAASDGAVASAITLNDIKRVINTLQKQSALTFSPMATGSTNVGTTPHLPAYWGITHPDVAIDIAGLSGFKSVETYAGQVSVAMGEFGSIGVAGQSVRFLCSEKAGVDVDSGAAIASLDLNSNSANVDLYSTVIFGQDAHASVSLGTRLPDGTYMAGDSVDAIDIIVKQMGSGGTSDPFNEISTAAWKAWYAGAITNSAWLRVIRSGATNINN